MGILCVCVCALRNQAAAQSVHGDWQQQQHDRQTGPKACNKPLRALRKISEGERKKKRKKEVKKTEKSKERAQENYIQEIGIIFAINYSKFS